MVLVPFMSRQPVISINNNVDVLRIRPSDAGYLHAGVAESSVVRVV